jgi:hypothetical protein
MGKRRQPPNVAAGTRADRLDRILCLDVTTLRLVCELVSPAPFLESCHHIAYLKDKEAAEGLSKSLNHLLAGKVLRANQKPVISFASEEGRNLRILHWEGVDETIARLAENAPESVHALKAVTDAAPKVDPNTKVLNPSPVESQDPRFLPLKALDNPRKSG